MEKSDPDERSEGIGRSFPDGDGWVETPAKDVCPKCGLTIEPGTLRCPRCNALLLMGCGGSCATCGSRSCAERKERG